MHDKYDIIRMDDHRPQPPEPRPAPRRDWVRVANDLLTLIVVALGLLDVAKMSAAVITWLATSFWSAFPAAAVAIQIAFALMAGAWGAMTGLTARRKDSRPPHGFHDAGESCAACGGEVWTPDVAETTEPGDAA